jgi:hypothetical protein
MDKDSKSTAAKPRIMNMTDLMSNINTQLARRLMNRDTTDTHNIILRETPECQMTKKITKTTSTFPQ